MKTFPKKSLGQNFLVDQNIIKKIIELGEIKKNDIILEVGPGNGELTKDILKKNPKKIYLVEKDLNLYKNLKDNFRKNVEIFNNDILNFEENNLSKEKLIVFGNLPYNISTQILVKWIINFNKEPWYKKLVLMFQKDVAERILAKKNTKEYGRLSIISNWKLDVYKNFDVSKNCFFPKPKVESTVLTFLPKKEYTKFKDAKNLELVTRIFFSQKRKMINKPVRKLFKLNEKIFSKLKIDQRLRPGNLDHKMYYKITNEYEKLTT